MIIECPNCSFEQPREGDYCPNCGGELNALFRQKKLKEKKEGFKTKAILGGLSVALVVGYFALFFFNSPKPEQEAFDNLARQSQDINKIKLKPSKIVSRASAPKRKSLVNKSMVTAVSEPQMKVKPLKENEVPTEALKAKSEATDPKPVAKKSIQGLSLIDRFECADLEIKTALNEDSTSDLLSCSEVLLSEMTYGQEILLEDGETPITFKVEVSETTIDVTIAVLVEEETLTYEYFFNIPQTTEATESLAFSLRLKQPSEKLSSSLENSEVLPLFFKDKNNPDREAPSKWSPLVLHATF